MKVAIGAVAALAMLATPSLDGQEPAPKPGAATRQVDHRDLVVMVRVSTGPDTWEFGSGIIAAQTPAETTIVTAAHVVKAAVDGAGSIEVTFRHAPTARHKATISPGHVSPQQGGLDLAVLLVKDRIEPVLTETLGEVLPPPEDNDPVGQGARLIGNMRQRAWSQSEADEPVTDLTPDRIVVASMYVAAGASGGAIISERGSLLGMTLTDDGARVATGLPTARLLDMLRQWKIIPQWTVNTAAPAMAAIKRLRSEGRLQAASLAEAVMTNERATLKDVGLASRRLEPSLLERALKFPAPGQPGQTAIGEYLVQSAADSEPDHQWLIQVMRAGVDPNLRLFHAYYGEESILAVALRAGNGSAAAALLDAGASPHPYQALDGTSSANPLFLAATAWIQKEIPNPQPLMARFIEAGLVPRNGGGGSLATTSTDAICRAATARSGVDWCAFTRNVPLAIAHRGPSSNGYRHPIYGYGVSRLHSLLHISNDTAYFLTSSGDMVVEVPRQTAKWAAISYGSEVSDCKALPNGQETRRCWSKYAAWPFYLDDKSAMGRPVAGATASTADVPAVEALWRIEADGITLAMTVDAARAALEKRGYAAQKGAGSAGDVAVLYEYARSVQGEPLRMFDFIGFKQQILLIHYYAHLGGAEGNLEAAKILMAPLAARRQELVRFEINDPKEQVFHVSAKAEGLRRGRRVLLDYGTGNNVISIDLMQRPIEESGPEKAYFDGYWHLFTNKD